MDCALLLQRQYGASPKDIAESLRFIGFVRYESSDFSGAISAMRECIIFRKASFGQIDDTVVVRMVCKIANCYKKLEAYDEALRYNFYAMKVEPDILSAAHIQLSEIQYRIGHIYFEKADYDSSLLHLQKALEIQRTYIDDDSNSKKNYNLMRVKILKTITIMEMRRGNIAIAIANWIDYQRICKKLNYTDTELRKEFPTLWRFELVSPNAAGAA
jgi:tetratricopeptide (TPR) repeat protein